MQRNSERQAMPRAERCGMSEGYSSWLSGLLLEAGLSLGECPAKLPKYRHANFVRMFALPLNMVGALMGVGVPQSPRNIDNANFGRKSPNVCPACQIG